MPPADSPSAPPSSPPSSTSAAEIESATAASYGSAGGSDEAAPSSLDVSDNCLELGFPSPARDAEPNALYVYKNTVNLIPRSVRDLGRLRILKFFSNEINVLPSEAAEELGELECLQVKVSSPALSSLPLRKLRALKELELSRVPARPSAFSILTEIANLKCLTRLSVCNFSIRFLPPEIGCLKKLVELDLSCNKLKSLPDNIASLEALVSLRVANNKLVDLPSTISCMKMLESLDISNNRLTSLQPLDLSSMHALRSLNIQFNKLLSCCQIPSWICCKLEGNKKKSTSRAGVNISVVEVDDDVPFLDAESSCSYESHRDSSTISEASSSSSNRFSLARKSRKGWKRRDLLQRRARQERLNNSRMSNTDNHIKVNQRMVGESCQQSAVANESTDGSDSRGKRDCQALSVVLKNQNCDFGREKEDECTSNTSDLVVQNKKICCKCKEGDSKSSKCFSDESEEQSLVVSSVESSIQHNLKPKRHSDRNLDSPKPRKCLKPMDDSVSLSRKYNQESFCGIDDFMPDGFYDAGRDRPFMTLEHYERNLPSDSREVILLDRKKDEELDIIVVAAQVLLSSLTWSHGVNKEGDESSVDNLQRASVLALFVSNCFGGSDRSNAVVKARKAVSGSNYEQPFICTCLGLKNNTDNEACSSQSGLMDDFNFIDLCEKSIELIKRKKKSNIVPIGSLRFGICRHRALLMKYLCDRALPPIPCELVRGYLDFMPHAWNAILVQKDDVWVRMIVDACCPTDIREENNPEYFSRYIPLTRVYGPVAIENLNSTGCLFPSISMENDTDRTLQSTVVRCKFGNFVAAAKVRSFDSEKAFDNEIKKFEHSCLGEVRLLGVLSKHPCIVEIYGHQLSSKWAPSANGTQMHRSLQFRLITEFVEGGSLKRYLDKLVEKGEKRVPVDIALIIARAIASALVEVHAKQIIHRDIKTENVLIDLDDYKPDGTLVVKLCDFDRAVPLQSASHSCVIGHSGVPSPDVCVGTPRWMAPEVLHAMHTHERYGLEVDIWSYGCLLLELLTLKVPYAGLSFAEINHLLQSSQRPSLAPELEALVFSEGSTMTGSDSEISPSLEDVETLKFLVNLFHQCTRANPGARPTAQAIYDMVFSAECKSKAAVDKLAC